MGVVGEEGSSGSAAESRDWWGEYVVLSLVERAADAVVEIQKNRGVDVSSELYGMESFKRTFGGVVAGIILSEVDLTVLIRYLERDRGIVMVDKGVSSSGCFTVRQPLNELPGYQICG
jgi:charged multivesicular body protein 7